MRITVHRTTGRTVWSPSGLVEEDSGWLVLALHRNNIAESVGYSYLKVDSISFGRYIVWLLHCMGCN